MQFWQQCTSLPSVALCAAAEAACGPQLRFSHDPLLSVCFPVRRRHCQYTLYNHHNWPAVKSSNVHFNFLAKTEMEELQSTRPATFQSILRGDMVRGALSFRVRVHHVYTSYIKTKQLPTISGLKRIPGRVPATFLNKPVFNTYTDHKS